MVSQRGPFRHWRIFSDPYVERHPTEWSWQLSLAEFAANNAVNSSTGFLPFYLNSGDYPVLPIGIFRWGVSVNLEAMSEMTDQTKIETRGRSSRGRAVESGESTGLPGMLHLNVVYMTLNCPVNLSSLCPFYPRLSTTQTLRYYNEIKLLSNAINPHTVSKIALEEANTNMSHAQRQASLQANKSQRDEVFAIGDEVVLSTRYLNVDQHLPAKLRQCWVGPFTIE